MNTAFRFRTNLRTRIATHLFVGVLLGLASAAIAHHGNPQAPEPAPWSSGPATPGLPGPTQPQGPGF